MKKLTYIIAASLLFLSCSNDDDKNIPGNDLSNPPAQAALTFPANNEECNQGTDITDTQSTVTFKWAAAQNAGYYKLVVKNLISAEAATYTTTATELPIPLDLNTPYSWYVISGRDGTSNTAQSDTWKLYNAGPGATSHIPFPAEAVSPQRGAHLTGTAVNLQWSGSDLDGDIDSYQVYFGTDANPSTLIATTAATNVNDVPVTAGTVYYWSVVTYDAAGNSATSEVFQFKID
jgi:hypothetical protein